MTPTRTITGTAVLYWAVAFLQSDGWKLSRTYTNGVDTSHSASTVLGLTELSYGPVSAFAVAGPYWTPDDAQRLLTMASSDSEFFWNWIQR